MKRNVLSAIAGIILLFISACDEIHNPFLSGPQNRKTTPAKAAPVTPAPVDPLPVNPAPVKPPAERVFTIAVVISGNVDGDTVTATPDTGHAGDTITLAYTIADTARYNFLDFDGVAATIISADTEDGERTYVISAADASNGVITFTAVFTHTDLETDPIAFNERWHITITYGDAYTNAITDAHRGTGTITYTSSDRRVATVNSLGQVTTLKPGTTLITAEKAADAFYAYARKNYRLTVIPRPVTISGLSAANKMYDGTTTVTITGTAVIEGAVDGDNLSIGAGTAEFEDAEMGNGKTVTFNGWSLTGADAGKYILAAQPAAVTADITKFPGAAVSQPVVNGTPGYDRITVNAVSLQTATGQSIEYAIGMASNGVGLSAWQSGTTFTGLNPNTYYYVSARSAENDTYAAGTASISAGIKTALIQMIQIPAGTFTMGSPDTESGRYDDEGPQHTVTLSGFYMGKYEVTQEQYQAVMGSNPSYFHGGSGREPAAGENQGKRPVEQVSWYDALVFCNKLSMTEGLSPAYRINGNTDPVNWGSVPTGGNNATWNTAEIVAGSGGYRLPTEAQWEYACRAGTTMAYNTGNTISDNTGWYSGNSGSKTHQVGLKPANAWGLYDMHGNVCEWCWDWFNSSYYTSDPATNPAGPTSGTSRVGRGGSWSNAATALRSAYRGYNDSYPYGRYYNIGLRLVRP